MRHAAFAAGIAMPGTVILALVFLIVGIAATILMYRLWAYPFDKETRTSSAPRWAMRVHRGLGYLFAALYVALLWRMVPRLLTYQVEFPARTVVHILLGVTVGFLVLLKILIARFFRHFEEWMPYLGTAALLSTILMLVLSLPPFFREHALAHEAPGGDPFSAASRERVARLLPDAELPEGTDLAELAREGTLRRGRDVLIEQCTRCHDLRTILERPRTPGDWWSTVERMGEKPALFSPMRERDLLAATAYLIAITPDLQRAAKLRRAAEQEHVNTEAELDLAVDAGMPLDAGVPDDAGLTADAGVPADAGTAVDAGAASPPAAPEPDPKRAKATYQRRCSGCHELSEVAQNPPRSRAAVKTLVRRMVDNGLEASRSELALITWWLEREYVR